MMAAVVALQLLKTLEEVSTRVGNLKPPDAKGTSVHPSCHVHAARRHHQPSALPLPPNTALELELARVERPAGGSKHGDGSGAHR